jgi:hypothetical protein
VKVELRAGATVDLLSPDEHHEEMQRVVNAVRELRSPPTIIDHVENVATDAGGLLGGGANGAGEVIYACPPGIAQVRVVRGSVAAPGFTPAAPLAAGWIVYYRDRPGPGNQAMILPAAGTTVLPVVFTEGDASAIRLRAGERLAVAGEGLPANLRIAFAFQLAYEARPTA